MLCVISVCAVEKRRRGGRVVIRGIYLIILLLYTGAAVCSTHVRNNNTRVMERVES